MLSVAILNGEAQTTSPASVAGEKARASASLLETARALAAAADTAGAVAFLKRAAESSPDDAIVWHEYGMLLSAWSKAYWRKGIMPNGIPQRIIAAESSLARAMRLAPDSASYAVDYGRQLWGSNFTSLSAATRTQETALLRAQRIGDTTSIAESSDALGLFMYRRYESMINRRTEIASFGFDNNDYVLEPYKFQMYIDKGTKLMSPPLGEGLYSEAVSYFRTAREVLIDEELPFRHEAMALALHERWEEVISIARKRISQRPNQVWPWLALGVAEQRLERFASARAALDSGFARMPEAERARLLSATRLLPPSRVKFFDTLSVERRAQLSGVYWSAASPTLLVDGNPVFDEFRARVAYAEMMWTNEETRLKGAESDRGEILIRWGPPDVISTHGEKRMSWLYRTLGLAFFFNEEYFFGTANLDPFYRTYMLEPNQLKRPAQWANLPLMRRGVDSVAAQVARFRNSRDSIDVAVFAGIPSGALRVGALEDTTTIKTGVFAVSGSGGVQVRVTNDMRSAQRDTLTLEAQSWRVRMPSFAAYLRIEALEPEAKNVARAIRDIANFATTGFGASDVVIGTSVIASNAGVTARWSDFAVGPLTGNAIVAGKPVDLLWEVYEPTPINGAVRYRVSIALQRVARGGLVGAMARLSGNVRDAVVRSRGAERVAIEYDRTLPTTSVHAETVRLDLGTAQRGRYRMTVTITDLNSKQAAVRSQDIILVDR